MNKPSIEQYISGEYDVFRVALSAQEIKDILSYQSNVSKEFLQKEATLSARTEAIIAIFGIDTNVTECSSGLIELKTEDATVIAVVQQIKSGPNKSKERTVLLNRLLFTEIIDDEGEQFTQTYYAEGFNHKLYRHFTTPGLHIQYMLSSIDAFNTQQEYELFLEQIEHAVGIQTPLEKTD